MDMPASACKLYFVMSQIADDEGCIGAPKTAVIMARCTPDDLQILIAKGYVLMLDNGVALIKHWRINNNLRKDTFHASTYQDELQMVRVKDDKSYSLKPGKRPSLDACGKPAENLRKT